MSDYFSKSLIIVKKIQLLVYTKHIHCIKIQTHTKFNDTVSCIRSQAHFLVKSRMDNFSVTWEVWLDAHTLVLLLLLLLLLLELKSPCLPHGHLLLGWQRFIPSENRQKWMRKMGYQIQVHNHCRFPLQDLPN